MIYSIYIHPIVICWSEGSHFRQQTSLRRPIKHITGFDALFIFIHRCFGFRDTRRLTLCRRTLQLFDHTAHPTTIPLMYWYWSTWYRYSCERISFAVWSIVFWKVTPPSLLLFLLCIHICIYNKYTYIYIYIYAIYIYIFIYKWLPGFGAFGDFRVEIYNI